MRLPSFVFTLCLLLAVAFAPLPARADLTDASKSVLFEPVQISQLTTDDKRYLQMALAFENLYVGLLDGQWGAGSRKALTRYSYERFDTAPINDHLAELSLGMSKRIAFSGWDMDYLKTYGM